jgi:pyruvate dehydrogenase E1 component alpha subunit
MSVVTDLPEHSLADVEKLRLWSEMTRIRCFEMEAIKCCQGGYMGGWLNVQIGQEPLPVVIRSVMGPLDHSISSYRCLGHALASGMSMRSCMAELVGKRDGASKGKGGMHSFQSPETRFWGGYGFVSTQTPLACGLAFGLKHRGEAGVVFCCLGDGAVNQGAFHEALNLAALFHLPVVFIIENNRYAMGTSVARSSAMKDCLARRAEGYGMDWDTVEANDIPAFRSKLLLAHRRARDECRPFLLEVFTYRYEGHTIADANKFKYRARAEVEDKVAHHDPIQLWGQVLIDESITNADELQSIRAQAMTEAKDASAFARESPYPTRQSITEDVYWEVDHQTAAGTTGRHFFND